MKNKKQKYFIVYELVKDEKGNIIDIRNSYDDNSLKKVAEWLNIDYSNINKYIVEDINDLESIRIKQLNEKYIEKNNYFIFKDYE